MAAGRDLGGQRPRVAYIVRRAGPYHAARLAAARELLDLVVVEVSRADPNYAWRQISGADLPRECLLGSDLPGEVSQSRLYARLCELLDHRDPDVLCVPGWSSPEAMAALTWCRTRAKPSVLLSNSLPGTSSGGLLRRLAKRRVVGLCSAAFVAGSPHRRFVSELGMPAERIQLGYNVVDNAHFARGAERARADAIGLRERLGLPRDYLLCVARFIEEKALDGLLEAYRQRLDLGGTPSSLVLVGDGPLQGALKRLCDELGLGERVHFVGFRQYEELPAYYGLARAVVLTSWSETWGLVINEAMAAGLPVIVSNRCGCAEDLVVNGHNGWSYDPDDRQALAQHLAALDEPGAAERMGSESRRMVADWDLGRFVTGLHDAVRISMERGARPFGLLDRGLIAAIGSRMG